MSIKSALVRRFPDVQLVHTALVVRKRTGKGLLSQLREIVALRRGPGLLRPLDYYAYELYDDRRYTYADKQDFAGWRGGERDRFLWCVNQPGWDAICDDKLVAYALFAGLGFPYPEVYAVYHPGGRTFGQVPCLRSPAALADHLRSEMRYPFFGKRVAGAFGHGASLVEGIDRTRDVLILSGGTELAVDEYVETYPVAQYARGKRQAVPAAGYLFQARIAQHPQIDRVSGGRVSTLRMVVLLEEPCRPRLFRVTWKLPVGGNITDHAIGATGNVKCSIDPATGRVERVLRGVGPEGTPVYALEQYGRPIEAHPDTKETLVDMQLPDWDRVVALCLAAAATLPGLRYQSWDMALGPDGPLLLEVNSQGGLAQVAGCEGFNDATFRRFMSSLGNGARR